MRRLYHPIVFEKQQSEFLSAGIEQKKIPKNVKNIYTVFIRLTALGAY